MSYHNVNVTPSVLAFTAGNWSMPQTVTVTAINDARDECCLDTLGGGWASLAHYAQSADANFSSLSGHVHVHIGDDDTAGVTITPPSGHVLETAEGGASATYTVSLDTPPYAAGYFDPPYFQVEISLWSSDPDQVTISPATLMFDSTNWSAQTVTVTAVDDTLDENDLHLVFIHHSATTLNGGGYGANSYDGIVIEDMPVKIADNDESPPEPEAPIAGNDAFSVASEGICGNVLVNDILPGGATWTAVKLSDPEHGALTFGSSGSFTYTAGGTYAGSDSFTYEVTDGVMYSSTATVLFTDGPAASDDRFTIPHNKRLIVDATGVLSNDTNASPLRAGLVNSPARGDVVFRSTLDSFRPSGAFQYQPNGNYVGVDSFTYVAVGSSGSSQSATVRIRVTNSSPNAVADLDYMVTKEGVLEVEAPGLLANDTDADDGDTEVLQAKLITGPGQGSLLFNDDGSFLYAAYPNFAGHDQFTYYVTDGMANSQPATVLITVSNSGTVADLDVADAEYNGFWLSEEMEDDLGAFVDYENTAFPARILAHSTGLTGYTRVVEWNPNLFNVYDGGLLLPSGSLELDECDGDKLLTVTATTAVVWGSTESISMQVFDAAGAFLQADAARLATATASIESIEFTSDHNLIRENRTNLMTGGERYPDVEWQQDPKTGKPVVRAPMTQTGGYEDENKVSLKLTMVLHGVPNGTTARITGIGQAHDGGPLGGILHFDAQGALSLNGNKDTATLVALHAIGPPAIRINGLITWTLILDPGGANEKQIELGTTGSHQFITTFGRPKDADDPAGQGPNVVTNIRASRAAEEVLFARADVEDHFPEATPLYIIWQLMKRQTFALDNFKPDAMAWQVPDTIDLNPDDDQPATPGADCISIATYVSHIAKMMGLPGSWQANRYRPTLTADLDNVVVDLDPYVAEVGSLFDKDDVPNYYYQTWDYVDSLALILNDTLNNFEAALVYTTADDPAQDWYFPAGVESETPAYNHKDKVLTVMEQLAFVHEATNERGWDYSSLPDSQWNYEDVASDLELFGED